MKKSLSVKLPKNSMKVLDNVEKYTPSTNFRVWVYAIVRNMVINNYKKVVREQAYTNQSRNIYRLNSVQHSGFDSTKGAFELKEMRRVVNTLSQEYKIPFAMHVSGFKHNEIAEKLKLPEGTVKSRISFTCDKLQEELKDCR